MLRRALAAILGLVAVPVVAPAQEPWGDWRTIETAHFRIHYPAPFEDWARHAAGRIEDVHASVAALVGWAPPRPIEVVVADPVGDANGAAIPFLDRPEVLLWTSPPESESSIGDFGDWMEMVTTHEVAHVAHLTRPAEGWTAALYRLSPAPFGPLALGSPRWVMEGYATLVEGALTGSGRPHSAFRGMVLRALGAAGKLPEYSELDSASSWLGGSPPYLVGSAFLEWLAAREGAEALPRLWRQMASSGGAFGRAFRTVFRDEPEALYGRFRAETEAAALAEEKRLDAEGLVRGELRARLRGGTLALSVSPDGRHLLGRRDPSPLETYVAIWEAAPAKAGEADSAEGDEGRETPPSRPLWRLPRANGFTASDPRWMPDGRAVLFARRGPDAAGRLRWDLYRWDYAAGRTARVTRLADAADADPAPDGTWAVAVRGRFGRSALVRVDLSTGECRAIDAATPVPEEWPVWSHPRVSPDGRRIAALLHAGGRWRLIVVPVGGGAAVDLPTGGAPAGAPAWSPDGARIFVAAAAGGIWNVESVDSSGTADPRVLTRVFGGALSPAPAPDGASLYFLDFGARGVSIRRLPLGGRPLGGQVSENVTLESKAPSVPTESGSREELGGQISEEMTHGRGFSSSPANSNSHIQRPDPDVCYDAWRTQAIRPLVNFSFGPSGNTVQLGADSADVIERLHLMALGSMGDAIGPRGGAVAAAFRGWPVALSAQLFSALEKPGNQGLAPRPAFDEERAGGFLEAAWARPFSWGAFEARAGGGGTRVDALSPKSVFARALGASSVRVAFRRTRGRSGFGVDGDVAGSAGETAGAAWTQWSAGGRLSAILPWVVLSASARGGGTGGAPSLFDLYAVGGAPNAILPPGLDGNRIASPALPADVQAGRRFERFRAEADGSVVPIVLYAEWLRAWSAARPDPVRVVGAEVRLERLIPAEFGRTITFRVGAGWIVSALPEIHTGRGYAQLVYRP